MRNWGKESYADIQLDDGDVIEVVSFMGGGTLWEERNGFHGNNQNDTLVLGGKEFRSRFILGSGKFSLQLIHDVMEYGGSEIATIALRRANADSPENILDFCRNIWQDTRMSSQVDSVSVSV